MSMLNFYINDAGQHFSKPQRKELDKVKDQLRRVSGEAQGMRSSKLRRRLGPGPQPSTATTEKEAWTRLSAASTNFLAIKRDQNDRRSLPWSRLPRSP
ncbi:DUF3175 domain-containing protein [Rhizobium sp. YTU87027]|uniref:DUF3175 domain-containing protein n=1 Tax=Rhizobium sp. YTU87027 TaxID=3417741 RepID=UPI003D6884C8